MKLLNLGGLLGIMLPIVGCGGPKGPATPTTETTTTPTTSATPTAVTTTPAAPAATEVHYYKGTSTTTSADGKTPYGPPADDIVQRTTDPQAGTIVEDVISAGKEVPTTMRRIGTTAEFQASDEGGSFSGTLTYGGPEWKWDSWTYTIKLGKDGVGGSITGSGKIVDGTMMNDKMYSGPDGKPAVHIVEKLAPSTADEFAAEKKRLLAMPAPSHH